MQKAILILVYVIIAIAGIRLFVYLTIEAIDKQETVECKKWEQQSKEFKDFYLAKWQDDQCRKHGVEINAPVK